VLLLVDEVAVGGEGGGKGVMTEGVGEVASGSGVAGVLQGVVELELSGIESVGELLEVVVADVEGGELGQACGGGLESAGGKIGAGLGDELVESPGAAGGVDIVGEGGECGVMWIEICGATCERIGAVESADIGEGSGIGGEDIGLCAVDAFEHGGGFGEVVGDRLGGLGVDAGEVEDRAVEVLAGGIESAPCDGMADSCLGGAVGWMELSGLSGKGDGLLVASGREGVVGLSGQEVGGGDLGGLVPCPELGVVRVSGEGLSVEVGGADGIAGVHALLCALGGGACGKCDKEGGGAG